MEQLEKTSNVEYQMLREEILNISDKRHQTVSLLYTTVAATLAFALSMTEPLLFLVPFVVIIPTYLMTITQSHDINKIGAYLQTFCEGTDFLWETRLHALQGKKNKLRRWQNSFTLPFDFLSIISLLFFFLRVYQSHITSISSILKCLLAVICAGIIVFIKTQQKDTDKLSELYLAQWAEVKERW
jgi:uncharacterized membrane protein YhaH (DUF805 family)